MTGRAGECSRRWERVPLLCWQTTVPSSATQNTGPNVQEQEHNELGIADLVASANTKLQSSAAAVALGQGRFSFAKRP